MTRKVFWEDPYLTELATTVTTVDGPEIKLAATIFFAFAGGQESDHGTIGGHEVLDASKDRLEIVYTLPLGHGLAVGDPVLVNIQAGRRAALRRLHTAAEIVLELMCPSDRAEGGLRGPFRPGTRLVKVGANISPLKARIDFAVDEPIGAMLGDVADAANRIVAADVAIACGYSDRAAERRFWKISGFANVACGGTHPRRTGEVGQIRLKRHNPGSGKERVEITIV